MKNVLVIGVNSKYTHSNLALRYFKSYSKTDIKEYSVNDNIFDVFGDLSKLKHEIFCFSCYIWNIEYVLKLIGMIKTALPNKKIYLGGPEAGYNYKELILNKNVDGIFVGEGEESLLMLNQGLQLEEIPNLVYKDSNKVILNKFKQFDLNNAVFPYTKKGLNELKNKIVYFETSRGCMYNCSYCLSSSEGKTRYFSMDYVKKGLDFFIKNKVPLVKFVDRTFNDDSKRAIEILKYIKEHNISTRFHMEVSPLTLSDEFLEASAEIGENIQFELGIQTTNPDTMKAINRCFDTKKVSESIEKIPTNIHVHLDLIAGLPFETLKSFLKGFDYVYKLEPDMLQLGFLKLLHNTKLKNDADKFGILTTSFPPYEVIKTNTMTAHDIIKLKNMEKAVDRIYNSGLFKNTLYALTDTKPSNLFLSLGKKLSELERKGPVSREKLYGLLYIMYGDKISLPLTVDFLENNKNLKLPEFLNPKIPDKKERKEILERFSHIDSKKAKVIKALNKIFIVTDEEIIYI